MFVPVILSGGTGARLWPVSREKRPKPFMKLPDGQSLLQKTFARAVALGDVTEVLTVTNREYYFATKGEYQANQPSSFLLEPFSRNTAPAILLAALHIREKYAGDTVMLILPADHLIQDQQAFSQAVKKARPLAKKGEFVTFGICPTTPECGYGYIEQGQRYDDESFVVARFVEKPNFETAEHYVVSGQYLWNSGMFCFTADTILQQIKMQDPDLFEKTLHSWEISRKNAPSPAAMIEIDAESFQHVPNISIDYAVMEKINNAVVIPCNLGWSDIGSWNAISGLKDSDHAGNSVVGEALLVDVKNCYVQGEERIVAAVGVNNLIIVDTADALLVANRSHAQQIKQVVDQLKQIEHQAHKIHRTVHRPWGTYTILEEGPGFKVKRIVIKSGASTSLQLHHHRCEHWYVMQGQAKAVNGEKSFMLNAHESIFIPVGVKHRIENTGETDLILIEIQNGDYLSEDDIVRFEDQYGRVGVV